MTLEGSDSSGLLERTQSLSLTDPLPEIVYSICDQFIFDGESLLRLGAVNKFWRSVISEPTLWERLIAARFGPDAKITAAAPAQPATAIPGWCFFPGLDSEGDDCASPNEAGGNLSPADLAARAEELRAVAFNTQGWIKNRLQPFVCWNRHSYVPGVGMYVHEEEVARRLGRPLPPPLPEKAEPEARPPDFPGWVFFQMMDSPGYDMRHPDNGDSHFLFSCSTLGELAEVASRLPGCVAFNTAGYLKDNLHPQVHWRQMGGPCSWAGLYVREDVAAARRLWRHVQGCYLEPLIRYFQLAKSRLLAARDVDVAWLTGTYLARFLEFEPAAPAGTAAADQGGGAAAAALALLPPPEAVRLLDANWLDLNGQFNGVGRGRYRCVWLLRATRNCNVAEVNFRITLRAARRLELGSGGGGCSGRQAARGAQYSSPAPEAPGAASASASSAATTTGGGGGAAASVGAGSELSSLVVRLAELRRRSGPGWHRQRAGVFEVPAGSVYDVDVRLWDHGPTWKSGLMFKELLLERVAEGEEEEEAEDEEEEPAVVGDEVDEDDDELSLGLEDEWEGHGAAEWEDEWSIDEDDL